MLDYLRHAINAMRNTPRQIAQRCYDALAQFLKTYISFTKLAEITTPQTTWFYGLLPPLSTLAVLLALAVTVASGLWLWTALWAGVSTTTVAFLPFLEVSILGVIGTTLLNHFFLREILSFTLSTRNSDDNIGIEEDNNPTNLINMVEHLTAELNVHFRQKYPDTHQDMPIPRIRTFTSDKLEIISGGRDPQNAGLFISDGATRYAKTRMNQKQLAALIQRELIKIYLRRGFARTLVGMGNDLLTTLQSLSMGEWLFKSLYIATMPIQFFLLIERAMNRSYEYEANSHVTACGRGLDLVGAIDRKVHRTIDVLPTNREINESRVSYRREAYTGTGLFSTLIKPIADWIDEREDATDDKHGSRAIVLLDIMVREWGFYIKESFSNEPRATNQKVILRREIRADDIQVFKKGDWGPLTLDNAGTDEVVLHLNPRALYVNRELYKQIPKDKRYIPISPHSDGFAEPNPLFVRVQLAQREYVVTDDYIDSHQNNHGDYVVLPRNNYLLELPENYDGDRRFNDYSDPPKTNYECYEAFYYRHILSKQRVVFNVAPYARREMPQNLLAAERDPNAVLERGRNYRPV